MLCKKHSYHILDKRLKKQKNKKIISFCLYGLGSVRDKIRNYYDGIFVNYYLAKKIYPDWICRVYIDYKVPKNKIDELFILDDLEIIVVKTDIPFMCVRFLPFDDRDVDIWISRDLDSIIRGREKQAVDEWLESDKSMHMMHDHKHHIDLVLGGMFGIKNKYVFDFIDFINNYSYNYKKNYNINYGYDIAVLIEIFNKYYKNDYIQHYRGGYKHENSQPFKINGQFVGKAHNMKRIRNKMNF